MEYEDLRDRIAASPRMVKDWLSGDPADSAAHETYVRLVIEGDAIGAQSLIESELRKEAGAVIHAEYDSHNYGSRKLVDLVNYWETTCDELAEIFWLADERDAKREAARIAAQFEADAKQAHYDHVCERGAA